MKEGKKNYFYVLGILFCMTIILIFTGYEEAKEFKVKNGVLLSYTGSDSKVILPKWIEEISETAFQNVPADQITEITFSDALVHVEMKAFANLSSLETIVIPESNQNFFFEDGVLGKTDGSAYWVMTVLPDSAKVYISDRDCTSETEKKLLMVVHKLEQGALPYFKYPVLAIGSYDFELDVKYAGGGDAVRLIRVNAYGQKFEAFGTPFYDIEGNFYFDIIEYEDKLLLTHAFETDRALLVLCAEGIHYAETKPDLSKATFGKDSEDLCMLIPTVFMENGRLRYTKEPAKFVHLRTQVAGVRMQYCVSRNEFFLEEGTVSFDGAIPVFTMENRKTISEAIDIEAEFLIWKQTLPNLAEETLEMYLEKQAKLYKEAIAD